MTGIGLNMLLDLAVTIAAHSVLSRCARSGCLQLNSAFGGLEMVYATGRERWITRRRSRLCEVARNSVVASSDEARRAAVRLPLRTVCS